LSTKVAAQTVVIERIDERCKPCSEKVDSHDQAIHGNGRNGLLVEIATLKSGRTDTLSVKGVCTLVGAIGALAATIGAAMAAFAP
jgi:hypothetical protein